EMFDAAGGTILKPEHVAGTGPFILTDFVPESSVSYVKNPDYWGTDEVHPGNKLPYVDAFKFLMIYDLPTRLAALRSGKMDYIFDLAPQDGVSLTKTNPELLSKQALSYLAAPKFNMRQDLKDLPFSDIRVRYALAMSIDRDKIIKEYLLGNGAKNNFPVMEDWTVYVPIKDYPADVQEQWSYNPEKSKQLLTEAGYPNGFSTEIVTEERYRERVEIVAAYMEAIGVKTSIRVVDRATWTSMAWGYGTKTYPQMIAGGAGAVDPLSSMQNKLSNAYYNTEMYASPEFDAMVDKILATPDVTEQGKLYREIQQLYFKDVSCFCFPGEYVYHMWQPWVKGYNGEKCLIAMNFGGVAAHMWLDKAMMKAKVGR
ncbi:MAG: ABC transporter substrate-binding protein, partial [Dehalococcoidales bacterium]|nr:ABC transporter substrate-binding protein [Dehalococcoidales bacterium]